MQLVSGPVCLRRGGHSVLANQFQQDLAGDSDEQDSDEHPQRPAPTDEDRHDREHHGHADRKRDGARKDPLSADGSFSSMVMTSSHSLASVVTHVADDLL